MVRFRTSQNVLSSFLRIFCAIRGQTRCGWQSPPPPQVRSTMAKSQVRARIKPCNSQPSLQGYGMWDRGVTLVLREMDVVLGEMGVVQVNRCRSGQGETPVHSTYPVCTPPASGGHPIRWATRGLPPTWRQTSTSCLILPHYPNGHRCPRTRGLGDQGNRATGAPVRGKTRKLIRHDTSFLKHFSSIIN